MGHRVILDTCTLLKVTNREPGHEAVAEILDRVESGEANAAVSTITIAEVAVGYHTSRDEAGLRDFITRLRSAREYIIADLDTATAELAGRIRAETGMRLPDAIIAASGVLAGASHVITDDRQFARASAFIAPLTPEEFLERLG